MIPPEPPASKRPLMWWRGAWRPIPRRYIWRAKWWLLRGKRWDEML